MSSWRVRISFSKLLWENVFLKIHAKSKVFQKSYKHGEFFELFVQLEQNFNIFTSYIQALPYQALNSTSRVQRRIHTPSVMREFEIF